MGLPSRAAEGYDPMLQITHQFVHPNILIVQDVSGSMAFSVDYGGHDSYSTNSGYTRCFWGFKYSDSIRGSAVISADYSVYFSYGGSPSWGTGQGYWMRAGEQRADTRQATIYTWDKSTIYVSGRAPYSSGDVITISGAANKDNGTYQISSTPSYSYYYNVTSFHVVKQNADGTYESSNHTFSLHSDITITITRAGASFWYFVPPSRMAILKNALGNSIGLYSANVPAGVESGADTYGKTYYRFDQYAGPVGGAYYDYADKDWVGWTDHTKAPVGDPAYTSYSAPSDLIGNTSNLINWGLVKYSGDVSNYAQEEVQVNPNDNAQASNVSTLETRMGTVAGGGLNPAGGTPTSKALDVAKASLSSTYAADTKSHCGRVYAAILVTDGQSNTCNPHGNEWSGCSDSSTDWNDYPPGRSDELFLKESDDGSDCATDTICPVSVRTFVIGVSPQVAKCELNHVAYMGRTDAAAADGGIDYANDQISGTDRLPQNDSGNTSIANYHPDLGDYAFFSNTASDLQDAFATIIAAVAAGDYTTSAPVASSTTTTGSVAILASAQFPTWKGHLYAFDLTKASTDASYDMWDAGEVLASTAASSRNIYTWDASNNLVAVTSSNLSTLQSIATTFSPSFNGSSLTGNVVDFIRGNDGNGTARSWKLGAIINSTPAVLAAPDKYKQGTMSDHTGFEGKYDGRTPVVWVGSSDGMLHCFKMSDGTEVLALLPPNLLSKEVQLYDNYQSDPVRNPLGEPRMPSQHLYTMSSSPRYGDVYFGPPTKDYKTVLLLTEGPGGDLVAGIDVTDVVPSDTNYVAPTVLWTKTGSSPTSLKVAGIHETWSVPAFGFDSSTSAQGIMGSGFYPSSTATSQAAPDVFTLNPGTGAFTTSALSNAASPLVGNQAFASSVIYSMTANAYYPDSIVDLGLQTDLDGRIWFLPAKNWAPTVGIDASAKAGQTQPLYYSPAVIGYYQGGTGYDLYAFASGTFYERSEAVTGANVGQSGYFIPSLFLVAKPMNATKATNDQIIQIPIQSINLPGSTDQYLGPRTQVTSPPMLFVPVSGSGNPKALFLVYDPDTEDCGGTSYIVEIDFNIQDGKPASVNQITYEAGEGAGSGFAIAGSKVIVARSGIGKGKKASVSTVPGINPSQGLSNPTPSWWRELK
jgi:hypothetical protein